MQVKKSKKIISLILLCFISLIIGFGLGEGHTETKIGEVIYPFIVGFFSSLFFVLLFKLFSLDRRERKDGY